MKNKISILTISIAIMVVATVASAQQDCETMIAGGYQAMDAKDYGTAISQFYMAMERCKRYDQRTTDGLRRCVNQLQQQKIEVTMLNAMLTAELKKTEELLAEKMLLLSEKESLLNKTMQDQRVIEVQNVQLRDANRKQQEIINAIYFYDDRLAVSAQGNYFGYINKEGGEIIPANYTRANNFFEPGFAEVEADGKPYLIDTKDNRYPLSERYRASARQEVQAIIARTHAYRHIPRGIYASDTLVLLSLRFSGSNGISEDIGRLRSLVSLRLDNTPRWANRLDVLDLPDSSDHIRPSLLPTTIGDLDNLQELILINHFFIDIPTTIGDLPQLRFLSLIGNRLEALPEQIGKLESLRTLVLQNNDLASLPATICQLKRLTTLDLSQNRLENLPAGIGRLSQLHTLKLNDNRLRQLPDSIGALKFLPTLDLTNNLLTTLPPQFGQLGHSLITLRLGQNQLSKWPNVLSKLQSLQVLIYDNNQLQVLPSGIGNLTALVELGLSNNELLSLPPAICRLERLQRLNLSQNTLEALPDSIGELSAITALLLRHNFLQSLPASMSSMDKLRLLDLHGNQLQEVPEVIYRLQGLQELHLGQNPCSDTPEKCQAIEAQLQVKSPKCHVYWD